MTTIVTLALDEASQAKFDALRVLHYPAALNRIAAHVTLFHTLPGEERVREVLRDMAAQRAAFEVDVSGLRSLGRGVAFTLASPELMQVHGALAGTFAEWLTAQDRQKFMPHVVVQNKVAPAEAKVLLEELRVGFVPFPVRAEGLLWWEYLGGPWRELERFAFSG